MAGQLDDLGKSQSGRRFRAEETGVEVIDNRGESTLQANVRDGLNVGKYTGCVQTDEKSREDDKRLGPPDPRGGQSHWVGASEGSAESSAPIPNSLLSFCL